MESTFALCIMTNPYRISRNVSIIKCSYCNKSCWLDLKRFFFVGSWKCVSNMLNKNEEKQDCEQEKQTIGIENGAYSH